MYHILYEHINVCICISLYLYWDLGGIEAAKKILNFWVGQDNQGEEE